MSWRGKYSPSHSSLDRPLHSRKIIPLHCGEAVPPAGFKHCSSFFFPPATALGPARYIRIGSGKPLRDLRRVAPNSNTAPSTGSASAPANTNRRTHLPLTPFAGAHPGIRRAGKSSPQQPHKTKGNPFDFSRSFRLMFPEHAVLFLVRCFPSSALSL